MATQKESETAETLAGCFTEFTNPKTPPGLGDTDNGNLGSKDRGGVQNGDSVSVNEQEEVCGEGNEFVGDGISLLVQVHGTLEKDQETEKEQLAKGGRESGNDSPVLKTWKKGDDATEKAQTEGNNEDGRSGNEADDDNDDDDDDERKDGVEEGVSEHTYSVGDYVWGKIKSHPWWPGRIYDPSDASEFAVKYRQTGRLLVVYFGDGSFSWCLPSQLKPFAENFEEMSKQSNIRSFVNAVDKALDEIRTLLVLEITCQCIPQDHIAECSWPLATNAGIKTGVLVPKGDTSMLSLPSYEPRLVLLKLRNLARTISLPRLEFVVLTSWLSAFYRAKGGCQLSRYCEPSLIEGLEDKTRNQAADGTDFSVPIEVPIRGPLEDEWVSYRNTGPINCPVLADDDKLYHHRKQKSVAELMGESIRSGVGNNSDGVAQVTETGTKECRKETDCCSSVKIAKKRNPPLSIKCSENGAQNNVGEAKEESEKSPLSRERKKSKYLSPPYTSPRWITGRSSSKREFEPDSEKISKTASVGEQMKAAAEVTPLPISGHNSEAMKEKVLERPDDLDKETQIGKENLEKIPGTIYTNASINQVLTEFQSTAIDPLYSSNSETLDMVRDFISAFRKSVYLNTTDYKVHNSRQSGRKRKSSGSLIENHVDIPSATNAKSQPRRKRTKLSEAETSELKKSFGETEDDKEVGRKAFPVSLIVTFSPGNPLPSKEELVRIFSRYGVLNEKETNTYYNSNCAQVVYENRSDAEAAFRKSVKQRPFGSAHVNYRLLYSSPHKQDPRVDSQLEHDDDDASEFGSIKQNLNILKSMLRKCNGKISQEEKFDLECEIKGLLEKVSTMNVVAPP